VPIVKKSGGLNLLETCGPVQACNWTASPLPFTHEASDSHFNQGQVRERNVTYATGMYQYLPKISSEMYIFNFGAKENIWTYEGRGNRSVKKTT
jgi:hypothetical protein